MEKVYDIHVHYLFDIPMQKTVEIFAEAFEDTGTEKFCFLSIPHHANGKDKLFSSENQNVKGLFLKHAFAPNGYAFAGLIHPQNEISDDERAENYLNQAVKYHKAGFDGIKMFEGHPTLSRAIGRALDDKVYDKFYSYLEENNIPIIMHVADPDSSWSLETASKEAKELGRTYGDDFKSKRQLTDEVFGILNKHPKLKLGLAHFGFMSQNIDDAHRYLSYKNTFFDLTPGGEQLINMLKNWDEWLAFFNKYQDRLIYGTDFYAFNKTKGEEDRWRKACHNRPDFLRNFFETDGEHLYINEKFTGVKIDKSLRDKLYRDNFMALLGEPKPINKDYFTSEIDRLIKNLPNSDSYYTKYCVFDLTNPEIKDKFIKDYVNDLTFMYNYFTKQK